MGLDPVSIAAVSLALSAAGAGVAYHQGEKQREAIETEKGQAEGRANMQRAALDAQKAESKNQENLIRTREADAARRRLAGKQGRSSTILTGPQGLSSGGATSAGGTNTLLGS